ncbi:cytochrome C oxidase subunit IV family protein [Desulfomicrobium escambiense]|uniref:cytochrome C oxidase subunit IV family protein n=1 Tax=Desulfomicrobium escambiense TaxID=29503 RepID=UPI00048B851B|nr:cytochrome C oxidase subunit IV family protein [Desulfomicrobium escambiense]
MTHKHIMPFSLLAKIWLALLILTGVTVGAASFDFGYLNVLVAMGVASTKALLVVLFFMHLKYENRLLGAFLILVFVILAIFIGLTFFDVAWRPEVGA